MDRQSRIKRYVKTKWKIKIHIIKITSSAKKENCTTYTINLGIKAKIRGLFLLE